jgi:hypothetical protein
MARDIASKPFKGQDNKLPDNLKDLDYDHYRASADCFSQSGTIDAKRAAGQTEPWSKRSRLAGELRAPE